MTYVNTRPSIRLARRLGLRWRFSCSPVNGVRMLPLRSPARAQRQADVYPTQGPQPPSDSTDVADTSRSPTRHRRFALRRPDVSRERFQTAVYGRGLWQQDAPMVPSKNMPRAVLLHEIAYTRRRRVLCGAGRQEQACTIIDKKPTTSTRPVVLMIPSKAGHAVPFGSR